ncbi:MAG TPA: hypothetical protein DEH78_00300 [Solibacterales bacterium]|nr:hypothetical protein [Bryobacterales bacterium]
MDPDVRAAGPAKCPRCGMPLVLGLPEPVEFPVRLTTLPRVVKPGAPVELLFEVLDPKTNRRVRKFEIVHEKLFHLFLVSDDLSYFAHEHPDFEPGGLFRFKTVLPQPGAYRVLCDFYPAGGTPQMSGRTLLTAGYRPGIAAPSLPPDTAPQRGENLQIELQTDPPQPLAGQRTKLFFRLSPTDRLEQFLGAWGHMLAASGDLIDVIHAHPYLVQFAPPYLTGEGHQMQFNLVFPRRGVHRVWLQIQRAGTVNTVAFNIPVIALG